MTPLEQAIHRANARLRVYREVYGIPVEGGWELFPWFNGDQGVGITIHCRHCGIGASDWSSMFSEKWEKFQPPVAKIQEFEAGHVRSYMESLCHDPAHYRAGSCPHLSPLLSEDTEEVRQHIGLYLMEAP